MKKYISLMFSLLVMDSSSNVREAIGNALYSVGSYLGITRPSSNELALYNGKAQEDFVGENSVEEDSNEEIMVGDSEKAKNVDSEKILIAQIGKNGKKSRQEHSERRVNGDGYYYSSKSFSSSVSYCPVSTSDSDLYSNGNNDLFNRQISLIEGNFNKWMKTAHEGFLSNDPFAGMGEFFSTFPQMLSEINKDFEQQYANTINRLDYHTGLDGNNKNVAVQFDDLPDESERSVIEPNTGDTIALIRSLENNEKSVVGVKLFGDYTMEEDVKNNADEGDVALLIEAGLMKSSN